MSIMNIIDNHKYSSDQSNLRESGSNTSNERIRSVGNGWYTNTP